MAPYMRRLAAAYSLAARRYAAASDARSLAAARTTFRSSFMRMNSGDSRTPDLLATARTVVTPATPFRSVAHSPPLAAPGPAGDPPTPPPPPPPLPPLLLLPVGSGLPPADVAVAGVDEEVGKGAADAVAARLEGSDCSGTGGGAGSGGGGSDDPAAEDDAVAVYAAASAATRPDAAMMTRWYLGRREAGRHHQGGCYNKRGM